MWQDSKGRRQEVDTVARQCTFFIPYLSRSKPPRLVNPPSCKFFNLGHFGCQNGRFFVVFRLHRVPLGDSSTYFIDFLLLVGDDLGSVWGCFFLGKPRLHNIFFYSSVNFQYDTINRDWKKSPQSWHKFRKLRGSTALYARKRAGRAC